MTRDEVFNFSAGPSALPTEVLEIAGRDILNYGGTGTSVMEMSHRSKAFIQIHESTKDKLRRALSIPETHEILFLQGGASLQFSMIPLNLMKPDGAGRADYCVTGNFSNSAMKEAKKYGTVNIAATSEAEGHTYIPAQSELKLDPAADYFYYCANNTIYGTEWGYVPETGAVPICCDMSSDILSKPVDVSKFGLIYAGAQKNMAPAGLTVVIIDKSLAGHEMSFTPLMMSYQRMIDKDSMFNTPPCWCIYMLGLVLDWLEKQGGVSGMEKIKSEKAALLYDYLAESKLFRACARPDSRSDMNITFRTGNDELDAEFVKGATAKGFSNLKGHRIVGGMRASVYNAQPIEGVKALVEYMKNFEVAHNV
ncbi:MAG: 3-phosphoserine/phosphohydroxythreonine transaminase [Oscillospiraceae bacterium]|jgi:phosphoserine aminotransferase|nr:3-phosphoserine/phosphohydroxythreonine transaminase [Oscillospiraceae bacterium]